MGLITMKSVSNDLYDDGIRINWYRGHSANIVQVYRNEWCLISDLVCCELSNGQIYIWCVSTSQLERRCDKHSAFSLNIDRKFYLTAKRNILPHLTKHEKEIYNLKSSYCNILLLDIRSLGDVTLDNEMSNDNVLDDDIVVNGHINNKRTTKEPMFEIDKLSDLISLQQFRVLICDISPCYGYCGDFESMTLLFPIASKNGGRWRIQPKVTAIYMLAINTICMWLLQCAPTNKLPVCSRLATFYHVMLPESINGFVAPSRNSMARYCLNSVSEIRSASRMLLHGIVQRMTDNMRSSLISKWKKRFCSNNKSNIANMSKIPLDLLLGAIVICIIHSLPKQKQKQKQQQCIVSDIVAISVINTLISVLMEKVHTNSDMIKISLSCDYLGKVIIAWFKYVDDVEYLLKTLLDLRNCDHFLLKQSTSSALLQCGVAVPQSFIKTMGSEALMISMRGFNESEHEQKKKNDKVTTIYSNHQKQNKHKKVRRHEQALMCIINLVQKYPQVLLKHIPLLVSTIIRCLDPSAPRRRKALLSVTTASLHVLVTKYPNVAFHQEQQLFAIGTGSARDHCILIYDLRTTTRWKQLKGHRSAVTAIEFNENGSYIISYSAYERPPTVKCWYIGSGGFLISLLSSGSAKCVKTCPMPPLDRLYPPIDHLQYTKLTWNNKVKGAVKLQRENQSVLFFTVLPK